MIARYVAKKHAALHAYVPPTQAQPALAQLLERGGKLVAAREMVRQSLRGVPAIEAEPSHLQVRFDGLLRQVEILMDRALQQ